MVLSTLKHLGSTTGMSLHNKEARENNYVLIVKCGLFWNSKFNACSILMGTSFIMNLISGPVC